MKKDDERLKRAFAIFDAMHQEDPTRSSFESNQILASLFYHQKLSQWIERLCPNASVPLRLAARSQHIRRWLIPRQTYPRNKQGYKNWRASLLQFHAETAATVLLKVGYDAQTVSRVQQLLRKERLRLDPEVQHLEDAACLVFLEIQLADFSKQHHEDKILDILRKTWRKMSPLGHHLALELNLPQSVNDLVHKAVSSS